ncbi:dTDP-4-dehydrorhamnose 3,5-epimerase family protein [uncultured Kordia sp.]|uniref:dTDP-4-dehydrorhamnose 3,5-epimerase family protein n=1 Tax=uncultured Kordia sp. TaxID=507699 RepID=UPI0026244A57|nr:dTDP-4-dehydrorhamnose 3,5-epimerase family protein [uncultured Kordia sp.]
MQTVQKPILIQGGSHIDERGRLDFMNDFNLSDIKRMYMTTHYNTNVIRAWQGHKIESRWFYCTQGAFTVKLVQVDDWENPSSDLKVFTFELEEEKPQVLYIPNGYVNGFKATKENSKLMILADYGLNEIENDAVRFDQNKWTTWDN